MPSTLIVVTETQITLERKDGVYVVPAGSLRP